VLSTPPGKTKSTIRIENAILDWFRAKVHQAAGATGRS
jgi:uncharacterized protein (DUF4415 family)